MAETKDKKAGYALKMIGGLLFLAGAVAVFIHRLPKTAYVEAHADKPRPAATAATAASSPAPAPAAAKAAAPLALAAPAAVLPLEDACRAEVGILCYKLAASETRGCLNEYEKALTQDCRSALTQP